jgi:hypothetical protein
MNKYCYIAGKIGGLEEAVYQHYFETAKEEVRKLGLIPISPLDFAHDHERTWEAYMKEDLTEMMKCGHVYALRNWRHSPGATIEIKLALDLGINIIHQK